jgi:hypothetical protein
MREADAGRAIHFPRVLASEKRVVRIRINSGNGNLAFLIDRIPWSRV